MLMLTMAPVGNVAMEVAYVTCFKCEECRENLDNRIM